MKIYGFYFIALINDWRKVIKPQLSKLFNSHLINVTDKLYIHIYYENKNECDLLESYLKQQNSIIEISKSNINEYEFPCLEKIKEKSKNEDFYCWYFHTKGVSITEKNKTFYHGSNDLIHLHRCVEDWRKYMEYFILTNYNDCIKYLNDNYDACGVQLSQAQNPNYLAFSGNFWWSKSSYIRQLPELSDQFKQNRWNAESWIGMGKGKLKNLFTNNAGYTELIDVNYKKIKTIAIFCLHYGGLTGSELYFYELIKILKSYYNICVYSNYTHDFKDKVFFDDVKFFNLKEVNTNDYDILLVSHGTFLWNNIKLNVNNLNYIPIINIIHSEVLHQEVPLMYNNVYKYITIRSTIKDKLLNQYNISSNKIEIIYNPIDNTRFNDNNISDNNFALFIGTMNHLRKNAFFDFINTCNYENIMYIGDINEEDKIYHPNKNIKYIKPLWNIEEYIKKSSVVGGIINGRSYWESKLCLKPTIEYSIDSNGNILNKKIEDKIDTSIISYDNIKFKFLTLLSQL